MLICKHGLSLFSIMQSCQWGFQLLEMYSAWLGSLMKPRNSTPTSVECTGGNDATRRAEGQSQQQTTCSEHLTSSAGLFQQLEPPLAALQDGKEGHTSCLQMSMLLIVSCECFKSTFIKIPRITTFNLRFSPLLFFLEYIK